MLVTSPSGVDLNKIRSEGTQGKEPPALSGTIVILAFQNVSFASLSTFRMVV